MSPQKCPSCEGGKLPGGETCPECLGFGQLDLEDLIREVVAFPWDDRIRMRVTARGIVVAASAQVEDPFSRSWLDLDERGTWEEAALEMLEGLPAHLAQKAREGVLLPEMLQPDLRAQAGNAFAVILGLRAIETRIRVT